MQAGRGRNRKCLGTDTRFDKVLSIRDEKVEPLLRCTRVGLPFAARTPLHGARIFVLLPRESSDRAAFHSPLATLFSLKNTERARISDFPAHSFGCRNSSVTRHDQFRNFISLKPYNTLNCILDIWNFSTMTMLLLSNNLRTILVSMVNEGIDFFYVYESVKN